MNLSVQELRPKYLGISYTADGFKTSAVILNLVPTLSTSVLEIGEKHVFASRRNCPITWPGRRIRWMSLEVNRRSELMPEEIEKIGLSKVNIGKVFFIPPEKRHRFSPAWSARLQGRVFVSDELHEFLRHILQAGKFPPWLSFSLEFEEGGLKYGWEPDGSRMLWKLESAKEPSSLNVTNIYIDLRCFRPLRSFLARLGIALGY